MEWEQMGQNVVEESNRESIIFKLALGLIATILIIATLL